MNDSLFNRIDLLVVPPVMVIIIIFLGILKKKQPAEIQKYFFGAFYLRILGTLSISAIIEFYYAAGDSYSYYFNAQALRQLFFDDPKTWLQVMCSNSESGTPAVSHYVDIIGNYDQYSALLYKSINYNATVCKIASLFNLICFNSSIGIALFFGLLSFLGCWYIFKTFVYIFPGYEKNYALLCLFLPSLWFWGSGILKDPLCMFALGILVYHLFVKKRSFLKRGILICLGAFLLLNIKPYIFYSFCVASLGGWGIYQFKRFGFAGKLALLVLFAGMLVFLYPVIANTTSKFYDDMLKESQTYIKNYTDYAQEGSSNIIRTIDPTPMGFFILSMQGFVTVYMRPFPWELNKVLYIFLILENLLIYYIIFKKVKTGPLNFRKNYRLLNNFSFIYFIFLGLIIGITAFNLGTIARYRVPALPFLFAGIFSLKLIKRKKRQERLLIL